MLLRLALGEIVKIMNVQKGGEKGGKKKMCCSESLRGGSYIIKNKAKKAGL